MKPINDEKTAQLLGDAMANAIKSLGLPSPITRWQHDDSETERIVQHCCHNCGRTREVEVPYPFDDFEGFAAEEFDCGCNGSAWQAGQ